jgi:hypothetical protein
MSHSKLLKDINIFPVAYTYVMEEMKQSNNITIATHGKFRLSCEVLKNKLNKGRLPSNYIFSC